MPAFVILFHEMPSDAARASHWDFMLEDGDNLRTWALECEPADGASANATLLAAHRLHYLDYEGPVSGNRGNVSQWDRGSYSIVEQTEQRWVVDLEGRRMVGRATLQRSEVVASRWLFSFTSAAPAGR